MPRTATTSGQEEAVRPARHDERLPLARPMTQPQLPVTANRPGQDLSCWSCHLLTLVLCYLTPPDLIRAGCVCRRWHAVASDYQLQARCFLNNYPCTHWRKIKPALDAKLARQACALWDKTAPSHSLPGGAGQPLAWLHLAPATIFYTVTRRMLDAERLSFNEGNLSICCPERGHLRACCGDCVYSPDGTQLAIPQDMDGGSTRALGLWHQDGSGLRQMALFPLDCFSVSWKLAFSTDSRRLSVVAEQGYLQTWQRQPDNSWQPAVRERLCASTVQAAKFSPDTRTLAIQAGSQVLVIDTSTLGPHQEHCSFQWSPHPGQDACRPDVMQFTADSHHFLFVNIPTAVVFDRCGNDWQAQDICHPHSHYGCVAASLAPTGDWLALVSNGSVLRFHLPASHYSLELWQRSPAQRWHFSRRMDCAGTGYAPPVAFSPDGRHLAFADEIEAYKSVCVSLLTRNRSGHWELAVKLRLGPGVQEPGVFTSIRTLSFSAHSAVLLARSHAGIKLWQRWHGGWRTAAWIASPDNNGERSSCALSPDGYHCAVAAGGQQEVRILGPGPAGRYLTKMQVTLDKPVQQMLFAPDGLRLLVSCFDKYRSRRRLSLLHLAPQPGEQAAATGSVADLLPRVCKLSVTEPVDSSSAPENRSPSP